MVQIALTGMGMKKTSDCFHGHIFMDNDKFPMIARQGQWVHTERLLQVVYDDPDRASESGLKSLIMRLRRKIGRELIVNGYGSGYRLQVAQRDS